MARGRIGLRTVTPMSVSTTGVRQRASGNTFGITVIHTVDSSSTARRTDWDIGTKKRIIKVATNMLESIRMI